MISNGFVTNKPLLWRIYLTAKAWTVRPSALLDISETLLAFQVDEAVSFFGSNLEAELNLVEGKTTEEIIMRREMVLNKELGLEQKYRDPAEVVGNG